MGDLQRECELRQEQETALKEVPPASPASLRLGLHGKMAIYYQHMVPCVLLPRSLTSPVGLTKLHGGHHRP